jgi:hypothetical protein
MSSISAGTTTGTALVSTGDTTGNLVFKTGSSNTTALTLSGTDQSATFAGAVSFSSNAFALGSASAPSITFTGDTNTGIFSPGADSIAFTEGGAEIARFDSSGNLGINTTSPGGKLNVDFGNYTGVGARFQYNNSNTPFCINALNSNGDAYIAWNAAAKASSDTSTYVISAPSTKIEGGSGIFRFLNAASGTAGNDITYTERLRIASAGQIGIGGANYGSSGQVLTSAGSGAAPSWQTVSGGVTSLNGQTGAITNTDYAAIGSYLACLSRSGVSKSVDAYTAPGTAIAGSDLYRISGVGYGSGLVIQESDGTFRSYQIASSGQQTSLSLSGTWRVLTYTRPPTNYAGTDAVPVLVVRVS